MDESRAYMVELDMVADGIVLVCAVRHNGAWFLARAKTVYGLTHARGGPADFARAVRESIWPPPCDRWPPGSIFTIGEPSRWLRISDAARHAGVSEWTLRRRHERGWLPVGRSVGGQMLVRAAHAAMPFPKLSVTDADFCGSVGWAEPVIVRRGKLVQPQVEQSALL